MAALARSPYPELNKQVEVSVLSRTSCQRMVATPVTFCPYRIRILARDEAGDMTPAFGTLRICEDAADLAHKGAKFLCEHAASRPGRTVVALSGGNTPKPLYELLAKEPVRSVMPWTG